MKIIGVIPARYESTRFPGKPLALICGKPMIWWVYDRAVRVRDFDKVLVATDSRKICRTCEELGICVSMTKSTHETGTDRIGEIAETYDADFYVNIQGDEPLIEPAVIQKVIDYKKEYPDIKVINTITPLRDDEDVNDNSIVKAVVAENGDLLYLSRAPVPGTKGTEKPEYKRHLGLYGLSRDALSFFTDTGSGYLERTESVEMLRFLENGYRIKALEVETESISVDLPEDIEQVETIIKNQRKQ